MSRADRILRGVPREIEMKLDLAGADAVTLEAVLARDGDPERRKLRAVYYDTPDRQLAGAGCSLRVRDVGGRFVQTVKQAPYAAAGLFDRAEWEQPVAAMQPVPDPRVRGIVLDAGLIATLAPIFEVRTDRRTWPAALHGGIEVSLDRVTIETPGRFSRFCEVELELKRGRRRALHALVRRLDAAVPLRLGVLGRAERGERQLRQPVAAEKAEPVALDPAMPATAAMVALIASCLRQYRLNEAILLERPGPEAVHQARVALRRLRSALAIFDSAIDDRGRGFDRPLRDLAATLGAARDLDVLIASEAGWARQRELAALRAQAYAAFAARLGSPETRALFFDLSEWLTDIAYRPPGDSPAPPIASFASRAMDRARRRLKRRAKDFGKQGAAQRHRVRKAAKRLRYSHDFFAPMFLRDGRARVRRFGKALARLQEHLGALNDIATSQAILETLGIGPQAGGGAGAKRERHLAKRARRALDKVLGARRFWRQPDRLLPPPAQTECGID